MADHLLIRSRLSRRDAFVMQIEPQIACGGAIGAVKVASTKLHGTTADDLTLELIAFPLGLHPGTSPNLCQSSSIGRGHGNIQADAYICAAKEGHYVRRAR